VRVYALRAVEAVPSTSPAAAAVLSKEVATATEAAGARVGAERVDRAVKRKGALKKDTAGSGGGEQKKPAGRDDELFQRQARAAAQTAARKAHSQLKVVERYVQVSMARFVRSTEEHKSASQASQPCLHGRKPLLSRCGDCIRPQCRGFSWYLYLAVAVPCLLASRAPGSFSLTHYE
jgi:hypothetical protein